MQLFWLGLVLVGVVWGRGGGKRRDRINDDSEPDPSWTISRPVLVSTLISNSSPTGSKSSNRFIKTTTLQRTASIVRVIPQFITCTSLKIHVCTI